MNIVAICPQGLEDVTQQEIREILRVPSDILIPGRVRFSVTNVKKFLVKAQSVIKVYELRSICKSVEEIKPFHISGSFRVICSRKGSHAFTSQDIERAVGEKFFVDGAQVDLEHPGTIVFVDIVDTSYFVGIDLTPDLLSKRQYRVKIHNQSLNACVAYGLVRIAWYKKGKTLVDPFAKDGVIAIEALRFQKGNVFAFDDIFSHVRNIEANATLAGIRKQLHVSRVDLDWLETKFEEGEIDCIVTTVPFPSKMFPEKQCAVVYKEFQRQVSIILHPKGRVVCCAPNLSLLKKYMASFAVVEERKITIGGQELEIVVFTK